MRADRLVSLLMLLQARGCMTAQNQAGELEVSVRTIYRDVDALCAAGVPVYTDRGPGGGVSLLDSYRTTLTGLTRDEARTFFMLSIPAPLSDLGIGHELSAALRKLAAALPASLRGDDVQVRQRIHLDPAGWAGGYRPVPHLETIYQAIWEDRPLMLSYQLPFQTAVDWMVSPFGLVAKAGEWYLVGARQPDGRLDATGSNQARVLPVSRVLVARLSEGSIRRPDKFDLPAFWKAWCETYEANRPSYPVTLRVAPSLMPYLPQVFGEQFKMVEAGADKARPGWVNLQVEYESLEEARRRILGLGGAVEVLEPGALRSSIEDYARQILAQYGA